MRTSLAVLSPPLTSDLAERRGIRIMVSMIYHYLISPGGSGSLSILPVSARQLVTGVSTVLPKMTECLALKLWQKQEYKYLLTSVSPIPEQLRFIFVSLISDLFINPTEGRITTLILLTSLLVQKICLLVLISFMLRLKALRSYFRSL